MQQRNALLNMGRLKIIQIQSAVLFLDHCSRRLRGTDETKKTFICTCDDADIKYRYPCTEDPENATKDKGRNRDSGFLAPGSSSASSFLPASNSSRKDSRSRRGDPGKIFQPKGAAVAY